MRRLAALAALIAALAAPASAMPGQTATQLMAWGKNNRALHGFVKSIDDETGGYRYWATVTVGGTALRFESEPEAGVAQMEMINLTDVAQTYDLRQHPSLIGDMLATIYGKRVRDDFRAARIAMQTDRVRAWRGSAFGYAVMGDALFVMTQSRLTRVLSEMKKCDAIECED